MIIHESGLIIQQNKVLLFAAMSNSLSAENYLLIIINSCFNTL
jgi:hypothetical protein